MSSVTALAAFLAAFLFASAAAAAPTATDREKAVASFKIGDAAYARGDFSGAAAAYEQAAVYAPHPSALLNAAESWELADRPARAAQLCDEVLASPSIAWSAGPLSDKHRQTAQSTLDRLEKKIGTIVVTAGERARIEVDGHVETAAKIRVAAGAHTVTVVSEGSNGVSEAASMAIFVR